MQVQVTESSQVEALSGTEPEIPKVASTPLSRQEEATAAAPGGVAPVEGKATLSQGAGYSWPWGT